jgi:hypothetical protein
VRHRGAVLWRSKKKRFWGGGSILYTEKKKKKKKHSTNFTLPCDDERGVDRVKEGHLGPRLEPPREMQRPPQRPPAGPVVVHSNHDSRRALACSALVCADKSGKEKKKKMKKKNHRWCDVSKSFFSSLLSFKKFGQRSLPLDVLEFARKSIRF